MCGSVSVCVCISRAANALIPLYLRFMFVFRFPMSVLVREERVCLCEFPLEARELKGDHICTYIGIGIEIGKYLAISVFNFKQITHKCFLVNHHQTDEWISVRRCLPQFPMVIKTRTYLQGTNWISRSVMWHWKRIFNFQKQNFFSPSAGDGGLWRKHSFTCYA